MHRPEKLRKLISLKEEHATYRLTVSQQSQKALELRKFTIKHAINR